MKGRSREAHCTRSLKLCASVKTSHDSNNVKEGMHASTPDNHMVTKVMELKVHLHDVIKTCIKVEVQTACKMHMIISLNKCSD